MIMKIIYVILGIIFLGCVECKKLPSFVEQCYYDQSMEECIIRNINKLKPQFKNGIPELGIPSLNPLKAPGVTLVSDRNMKLVLKNVNIYNIDQFELKDFKHYRHNLTDYFEYYLPKIELRSDYILKGQFLLFNLDTSGKSFITLDGVHAKHFVKIQRVMKHGELYLKINKTETTIEVGDIHIQFDDLFKNNPELSDSANKLVSENAKSLLPDMEMVPRLFAEIVGSLLEKVYNKFSLNELLPTRPQ
ncbi:uncharacterized protein LOC114327603 [Diabrotica virgifera virgifera]|uniref:Uncharacterized protein LOC114327603 n=1 Tax=Diabrotica virgifera virgifera TaxID=50390 RepID=A0A6P7F8E6_DIAVI|nr:uncharacterized protein LOC114327603 [Diabrotica virgifera virgifera]